jgi:hypothetical protein
MQIYDFWGIDLFQPFYLVNCMIMYISNIYNHIIISMILYIWVLTTLNKSPWRLLISTCGSVIIRNYDYLFQSSNIITILFLFSVLVVLLYFNIYLYNNNETLYYSRWYTAIYMSRHLNWEILSFYLRAN